MLKIGLIGAGRIGRVHLQSISNYIPQARVVAVAEPCLTPETEAFVKGFGVEVITKDYRDLLNDPEIDALLICSSTDTHASISLEAIAAGKHVFCEKPVDTDVDRILQVQKALEGTTLKYQVGFNRRFDHNFSAIRKAVDDGRVGEPHIIKITSRDPEPPNPKYIAVSGGIFLDMTIHDFDMARFLAGCDVEEVSAVAAVLIDPEIGKQGDVDTAVITMRMKNGAIAVIDNSRKAAYGYDQRAEVFGSQGMAASSNDTLSTVVLSNSQGVAAEKPLYFFLERYMQSFAEEMKQFIHAVETGGDVPVTITDGLEAVRIAWAVKRSVQENRPVRLVD